MDGARHEKVDQPAFERKRIQLIVGGLKFKKFNTTLARFPESRLSRLNPDDPEYDTELDAYVYNRNPTIFSYIMSAYNASDLHLPHDLCARAVKEELDFWQISTDLLPGCCYRRYRLSEEELENEARVEQNVMHDAAVEHASSANFCVRIYRFLSLPRSSIPALLWCIIYCVLLLVSCAILILGSLPQYGSYRTDDYTGEMMETSGKKFTWLDIVNLKFFIFFIIEWIIRFVTCPAKFTFLKSFTNLTDIIGTTLMLIMLIVEHVVEGPLNLLKGLFTAFYFLRTLRVLQLLSGWRRVNVVVITIRNSILDLLPLLIVMFTGMLVSSTMVYYMEAREPDSQMSSIPGAFWWSIITMTTVGYGDMTPIGVWSKIVGSFWAIISLLLIGVPIPIFIRNYARAHAMLDVREDLLEKAKPT